MSLTSIKEWVSGNKLRMLAYTLSLLGALYVSNYCYQWGTIEWGRYQKLRTMEDQFRKTEEHVQVLTSLQTVLTSEIEKQKKKVSQLEKDRKDISVNLDVVRRQLAERERLQLTASETTAIWRKFDEVHL